MCEYSKKELIKKLDTVFSLFIRMEAADSNGYCICPTCFKAYHYKDMDCSHYVNRNRMTVRWDERNVIAQCQRENRFQSGNIYALRQVLVKRYGASGIDQVDALALFNAPIKNDWLQMKIEEYQEKVKQTKKTKDL